MRRIVGLTGLKRAGKDTAAGAWPLATRIGFSDPLKAMLGVMLRMRGVAEADIFDLLLGERKEDALDGLHGCSARRAMQTLGTEWGRDLIASDLWTGTLVSRVARTVGDVVIPDVRMADEADCIRAAGGVVIRIVRLGQEPTDVHPSEALAATADAIAVNDGTPEQLHQRVRLIVDAAYAER